MSREYAGASRGQDAITRSLSRAHPSIVASINSRRRAMGLPEFATKGDPGAYMLRTATGWRSIPSAAAHQATIREARARQEIAAMDAARARPATSRADNLRRLQAKAGCRVDQLRRLLDRRRPGLL